jgi:hypothetical protein
MTSTVIIFLIFSTFLKDVNGLILGNEVWVCSSVSEKMFVFSIKRRLCSEHYHNLHFLLISPIMMVRVDTLPSCKQKQTKNMYFKYFKVFRKA